MLSKMPNDETRKTKSERNRTYRWIKRAVIALVVIIGVGYLLWQMNMQQQAVGLHHQTYYVSIVRTPEEIQRGLSGTDSLAANRGMLFVFPREDKWAIWMKDMNYPIDIVWLDKDAVVNYIVKNAQPSSYNADDPTKSTMYTPEKPARYVIELPSGTIERTGIAIGDPAGLPSGT